MRGMQKGGRALEVTLFGAIPRSAVEESGDRGGTRIEAAGTEWRLYRDASFACIGIRRSGSLPTSDEGSNAGRRRVLLTLRILLGRDRAVQAAVWIVIVSGAVGIIIAVGASWLRHDHEANLGSVSQQWVTEHRASETPHR